MIKKKTHACTEIITSLLHGKKLYMSLMTNRMGAMVKWTTYSTCLTKVRNSIVFVRVVDHIHKI